MSWWNGSEEDNVAAALTKVAGPVTEKGAGRWSVSLWNGAVHPVEARLDDGWLALQAAGWDHRVAPWDLLRANAGLTGLARFVLEEVPSVTTLQAEIPVGGDDLPAELEAACAGLRQALELEPDAPAAPPSPPEDRPDLARLCAEAGWPFEERDGGTLSVELETADMPLRARLEDEADGGLRLQAALLQTQTLGSPGRQAVATALLATSATVRMVRAYAAEEGDEVQTGFEVRLSCAAEPATLDHALAALSVSCGLCVLEARALQEETLAQRYLEVRGYAPNSLSQLGCSSGAGGS